MAYSYKRNISPFVQSIEYVRQTSEVMTSFCKVGLRETVKIVFLCTNIFGYWGIKLKALVDYANTNNEKFGFELKKGFNDVR